MIKPFRFIVIKMSVFHPNRKILLSQVSQFDINHNQIVQIKWGTKYIKNRKIRYQEKRIENNRNINYKRKWKDIRKEHTDIRGSTLMVYIHDRNDLREATEIFIYKRYFTEKSQYTRVTKPLRTHKKSHWFLPSKSKP